MPVRILIADDHQVVRTGLRALLDSKSVWQAAASAVGSEGSSFGRSSRSRLTPREREILQLLAEGKSNKEVADLLGISVKTAETHRANIMLKLDFHSITELVRYAVRNKIIQS